MSDHLSNPFASRQVESKEKTIKWCAWEVLKHGAELSDESIVSAIIAQNLRSAAKVPTISKQLGGDRVFVRRPGGWALAPVRSSHAAATTDHQKQVGNTQEAPIFQEQKKKRSREVGFDDLDEQLLVGGRRRNETKKDWWKVDDENEFEEEQESEEEEECGGNEGSDEDISADEPVVEQRDAIEKEEEIITMDDGIEKDDKITVSTTATVEAAVEPTVAAEHKLATTSPKEEEEEEEEEEEVKGMIIEGPVPALAALAGPKPFVIPKRGNAVLPPAAAAAAASSPERPPHREKESRKSPADSNKLSKDTREPRNERDRRERTATGNNVDLRQPKPRAEAPPLPTAPSLKEALNSMMRQNKGALASAMGRLRWPEGGPTLLLPAPEGTVTAEQRQEWDIIRDQLIGGVNVAVVGAAAAVDLSQNNKQPVQDTCPPLPKGLVNVRLMQCSANTEQLSLERLVFASNSKLDIDGIEAGRTMVLLHNFDKRCVYGCYRAVRVGRSLDPSFSREWSFQVRVEKMQEFSPLPAEFLEPFIPRRINQKDGKAMKFLEKETPLVREVWQLFALSSGKGFY